MSDDLSAGLDPGAGDMFDPWDLDDVRERVVRPVVAGLARAEEMGPIDVGWGSVLALDERGREALWVSVTVAASTWHGPIWDIEASEQLETLGEVAAHLADMLEDWMCEDVHWGEQAVARYTIPARPAHPNR